MRFTKMEGCGNDYIYINGFEEEVKYPDMLAVAMSERHFGVGADGLVLILPSEVADFRMRMFNMDGSEGEMCGNAVRCIGKYVYDHKERHYIGNIGRHQNFAVTYSERHRHCRHSGYGRTYSGSGTDSRYQ